MTRAHPAHVWFVGVTTAQSMIHRLLPAWGPSLGIDAEIVGKDLPPSAAPEEYRDLLDELERDDCALGAVVTSHKVRLLSAARDRFVHLDPVAALLGEVNAVRRGTGGFEGFATDARAIRLTLSSMLDDEHWAATGGDAVALGLGGSGRALALAMLMDFEAGPPPFAVARSRPCVFHGVARRRESLDDFAAIATAAGVPAEAIRLHCHVSPGDTDALLAGLPADSLVANATGLGKDAPGSPIGPRARFPERGIVWDFNYRGDLRFLDAAAAQQKERGLQVHDGWLYFLHGWSEALGPLLGRPVDDETFARLVRSAEPFRPAGHDAGAERRPME